MSKAVAIVLLASVTVCGLVSLLALMEIVLILLARPGENLAPQGISLQVALAQSVICAVCFLAGRRLWRFIIRKAA